MDELKANRLLSTASLFTSASTLVCCALPALFVSLGMGAALVGLIGAVPQLIWFSEHKVVVFGVAGVFLAVNGIAQYRSRNAPCPIEKALADACMHARKWSKRIYFTSIAVYLVGAFFAFVAPLFS